MIIVVVVVVNIISYLRKGKINLNNSVNKYLYLYFMDIVIFV